jgi:hypothetical protein
MSRTDADFNFVFGNAANARSSIAEKMVSGNDALLSFDSSFSIEHGDELNIDGSPKVVTPGLQNSSYSNSTSTKSSLGSVRFNARACRHRQSRSLHAPPLSSLSHSSRSLHRDVKQKIDRGLPCIGADSDGKGGAVISASGGSSSSSSSSSCCATAGMPNGTIIPTVEARNSHDNAHECSFEITALNGHSSSQAPAVSHSVVKTAPFVLVGAQADGTLPFDGETSCNDGSVEDIPSGEPPAPLSMAEVHSGCRERSAASVTELSTDSSIGSYIAAPALRIQHRDEHCVLSELSIGEDIHDRSPSILAARAGNTLLSSGVPRSDGQGVSRSNFWWVDHQPEAERFPPLLTAASDRNRDIGSTVSLEAQQEYTGVCGSVAKSNERRSGHVDDTGRGFFHSRADNNRVAIFRGAIGVSISGMSRSSSRDDIHTVALHRVPSFATSLYDSWGKEEISVPEVASIEATHLDIQSPSGQSLARPMEMPAAPLLEPVPLSTDAYGCP